MLQSVMRYTADKLVYIDFNDIIFANLYIGKDQSGNDFKLQNILIYSSYLEKPIN